MSLGNMVLAVIVVFAVLWLATLVTGLITAVPYGWLGLVPVALVVGLVGAVVFQRLTNREDDYYEKNVDK